MTTGTEETKVFQGKTITGFIMDLIREEMENIEDEKDVRAVLNDNEPSISWAELRKEKS